MGYRSYLWIGIGVFLAVAVAICVMAPSAKANNDPPGSGGTITGDWTVTDARSYNSVTITVQNGNIAIQAGGTLTLTNVNLRFSPSSGNIYSFTVQQGGTLTVSKGTITSIYSNIHYKFIIKGSATIDGATISEMWGDINSWAGGVQIYSDSASVTNCTITKGMTGGISIFDSSPVIAYNKITANGQDGQCTTYCFGLYAWNTKSNISSNLIYENNYQITISSYGYYYEYPGGWDYYSSQWVSMYGEYATYAWYYGMSWWGYTERDIQSETYGQAALYGLGVIIQGGSQATFFNNSVTKNGYHAPSSGGWTYNYYYEGSGYGYCPYMADYGYSEWDNYCDFYVYEQSYSAFSYSNYGKGLIIDNSTVDISGNTFDRNGFEPYHSYYADSNSACWYSGVDITMTNSCGNITGNTINDASILVDLSNSYTNLTDNKMLGDFIGTAPDPVSPVSSNVVPWNAV